MTPRPASPCRLRHFRLPPRAASPKFTDSRSQPPGARIMKNKVWILVPAALIAAPLLLALWYVLNFGYSWNDAWTSVRHFGSCQTRYAQQFSESNLERVRPGMSGKDVFNVLGTPMEGHVIEGKASPLWKYSLPKGDAAYHHQRAVLFDLPPGKPPVVKAVIRRLFQPDSSAS